MKYYLIKLLTNAQGQDGSTISVFDSLNGALVSYHNTLAAFHNAEDVLYSVVEIMDENGNIYQMPRLMGVIPYIRTA